MSSLASRGAIFKIDCPRVQNKDSRTDSHSSTPCLGSGLRLAQIKMRVVLLRRTILHFGQLHSDGLVGQPLAHQFLSETILFHHLSLYTGLRKRSINNKKIG